MAGVSVVLVAVLVAEVAPWSDENLAMEDGGVELEQFWLRIYERRLH